MKIERPTFAKRLSPDSLTAEEEKYRQYGAFNESTPSDLRYDEDLLQVESRSALQTEITLVDLARIRKIAPDKRVESLLDFAGDKLSTDHGQALAKAVASHLTRPLQGGVISNLGQVGLTVLDNNCPLQSALEVVSEIESRTESEGVKAVAQAARTMASTGRREGLETALKVAAAGVGGEAGPTLLLAAALSPTPESEAGYLSHWAQVEELPLLSHLFRHGATHGDRLGAATEAGFFEENGAVLETSLALLSEGTSLDSGTELALNLARTSTDPILRDEIVTATQTRQLKPLQETAKRLLESLETTPEAVLAKLPRRQSRPSLHLSTPSPEERLEAWSPVENPMQEALDSGRTRNQETARTALQLDIEDLSGRRKAAHQILEHNPFLPEKCLAQLALTGGPETAEAALQVIADGRFIEPDEVDGALLQAAGRVQFSDTARLDFLRRYSQTSGSLEQAVVALAEDHNPLSKAVSRALQTQLSAELGEGRLALIDTVLALVAQTEGQESTTGLKRFFSVLHDLAFTMTESQLARHAMNTNLVEVYRQTAREMLSERGREVPDIAATDKPLFRAEGRQLRRVDPQSGEVLASVTLPGPVSGDPVTGADGIQYAVVKLSDRIGQAVSHRPGTETFQTLARVENLFSARLKVEKDGKVALLDGDRVVPLN